MLTVIDDAWQEGVQNPIINAMGCMADDDYVSAFEQYVSDATLALIKHFEDPEVRKQVDVSVHPVIDSIAPKFKLVSLDFTNATYGLPVLTRSPIAALALHLSRIPLVLMEVCALNPRYTLLLDLTNLNQQTSRWFDPLVDYIVTFSKSSNSPSYTQAAIDATKRYDCLVKNCPAGALVSPYRLPLIAT